MAWSMGHNGKSLVFNPLAIISSVPYMLAGYYICERVLLGNWIVPAATIPGNLLQKAVGICVAIPVCLVLKRIPIF